MSYQIWFTTFHRYLISRLDEYGDGFREAQVPVMWEVRRMN